MNDDDRGFSPWLNQAAVGGPLDVSFGRARRVRFFSGGGTGRGGGAATFTGAGGACFTAAFAFTAGRALGFGGFATAFFATALTLRAAGRATFLPAGFLTPAAPFFPCTLAIAIPLSGREMNGAV